MSKIRDSHTGRIVFVNSKDFLSYLLAFGVLVRPFDGTEIGTRAVLPEHDRKTFAIGSGQVSSRLTDGAYRLNGFVF